MDIFSLSLEELLQLKVTSASFYEESYMESSSSVSLLTREIWSQRGDRKLSDVFMHLPSTMVQPYLAGGSISMRGYSSISSVRGTATVFDGVPLNGLAFGTAQYQMENLELAVLDSIEVVRGGASTLYGADAFHGAISMQPFRSSQNRVELDESYSSNEYYRHQLRASHHLGDFHRINIAYGASGRDPQEKKVVYTDPSDGLERKSDLDDYYDSKSFLFNVSGRAPSNSMKYDVTLLTDTNDHNDAIGIGRFYFSGQNFLLNRDLVSTDTQFDVAKVNVDYEVDENESFSFTGYYWQSQLTHDASLPVNARQQTNTDESRVGGIAAYTTYSERLDSDFSVRLSADKITVEKRTQKNFIEGQEFTTPAVTVNGEGDYRRTHGAAVQGKSYFNDRSIIVLYGLRHERFSDIDHHSSPKGGVIFKVADDQAVKVLYGNAYRPPTTVELRGIGLTKGNDGLTPELIDNYEIIYLKDEDHFRMEITGYYNQWKDGIVQVPCGTGSQCDVEGFNAQYQNLDRNSAKGVEFSLTASQEAMQYYFSLSYNQSVNEVSDIPFSAFPTYIINGDIGYGFAGTKGQLYWSNRLHIDADEAPETGSSTPDSLKDYFRSDLHLSYELDRHWKIKFDIRNIFNRSNFLPSIANSENGVPMDSRSIMLSARYQFD